MISGTSMMEGYHNLRSLNSKKIINGWFDTGDLGFLDKNKNLYLIGRDDNTFRVDMKNFVQRSLSLK